MQSAVCGLVYTERQSFSLLYSSHGSRSYSIYIYIREGGNERHDHQHTNGPLIIPVVVLLTEEDLFPSASVVSFSPFYFIYLFFFFTFVFIDAALLLPIVAIVVHWLSYLLPHWPWWSVMRTRLLFPPLFYRPTRTKHKKWCVGGLKVLTCNSTTTLGLEECTSHGFVTLCRRFHCGSIGNQVRQTPLVGRLDIPPFLMGVWFRTKGDDDHGGGVERKFPVEKKINK